MTAELWKQELQQVITPGKDKILASFFRTAEGEYGYGDKFIGVMVPDNRSVVKRFYTADLGVISQMLASPVHEHRLSGYLGLVERYRKAKTQEAKGEIVDFYLAHLNGANNWDLVDLSAPYILGAELTHGRYVEQWRKLMHSEDLWHNRIATVATMMPIRSHEYGYTLEAVERHLCHSHQLMHKACGWMLREMGKRDMKLLEEFLEEHIKQIAPITLSYAIERMNPDRKAYWRTRRKTSRQMNNK